MKRYKVEKEIVSGGYGTVYIYAGRRIADEKPVGLKFIRRTKILE